MIHKLQKLAPGFFLTLSIAIVAYILGKMVPQVGGSVFGIVFGIIFASTIQVGAKAKEGITFSSKKILQWSIILLGFGLSFRNVIDTGITSLYVTVVTIIVAFVSTYVVARCFGIGAKLKLLLGVGTAICGGSAIAAVTPIIKPDEHETALSISTIFLFNLVAVLVFPPIGHMLGLSDAGFGMWAGTAINDTSSVVAAGYIYSKEAGDYATIVKLTRATLIIPIAFGVALYYGYKMRKEAQQSAEVGSFSMAKIFPWFILWFLVASIVNSTGWLPVELVTFLSELAKFMIVVALTAIGLSTTVKRIMSAGFAPIIVGGVAWICVSVSSLLVQYASGQL